MKGFEDSKLLLLTTGWHCIRQLDLNTRTISTFSGNCVQPGLANGNKLEARLVGIADECVLSQSVKGNKRNPVLVVRT